MCSPNSTLGVGLGVVLAPDHWGAVGCVCLGQLYHCFPRPMPQEVHFMSGHLLVCEESSPAATRCWGTE